jgi:hypothetical protein
MNKPIHAKPGLYAMFYETLKLIAKDYGYNLLVNGSMNRDLDLVAVPWIDNPKSEEKMILEFHEYLTGKRLVNNEGRPESSMMPGNRRNYTISLNRGNRDGEWVRFADEEYYLDISVVQINQTKKEKQ